MAESKKSYKHSDVVLTAKGKNKKGEEVEYKLTPISLKTANIKGFKVSGEPYYVDKAIKEYGAKK